MAASTTRRGVYSSMQINPQIVSILDRLALQAASMSYTPYSGKAEGVVVLLEDGAVVNGCRVENASFQLSVSALINAWSTLHAAGRVDVAAIAQNRPYTEGEKAWLQAMNEFEWLFPTPTLAVLSDDLPEPSETLLPLLDQDMDSAASGIALARDIAGLAHTPQSNFPVGCVVRTADGHVVPGVNVEHEDWANILCAERNALSTLIAYGFGPASEIWVACIKEPGGTPCGACRQFIAELAPDATVWIDMGDAAPRSISVPELLPGAFTGAGLRP